MATVLTKNGNSITIQTTIELTGSMLEMETIIQSRLNEVVLIPIFNTFKKLIK